MPERPLCLFALLALSVLVGCSANRVAKDCPAVVLEGTELSEFRGFVFDRLEQIGVDLADVRKISYSSQMEPTGDVNPTINSLTIVGLDAWVRFHSCQGALIVDMTTYCYVRQIYTRGECERPGLPHYR